MCESHVSGCQFELTCALVIAHFSPSQLSPRCTTGFAVTYTSSSYSTNPLLKAGANATPTSNHKLAHPASTPRQSHARTPLTPPLGEGAFIRDPLRTFDTIGFYEDVFAARIVGQGPASRNPAKNSCCAARSHAYMYM
jgi:hypothetical protein